MEDHPSFIVLLFRCVGVVTGFFSSPFFFSVFIFCSFSRESSFLTQVLL
jgi:hypothetical protein